MGAKRRIPRARCPDPRHRGSHVVANGTEKRGEHRFRRYRCSPPVGDTHSFSVTLEDGRPVGWQPAPPCPRHPGSFVVRNGLYGKGAKRRQRYRCSPPDGGKLHAFTPPLPREHVHPADGPCPHCEERRGVHRGDSAAARRHRWPTKTVARGLARLAGGESYAEVSRWALRTAGISLAVPRRKASTSSTPPPTSTKRRKRRSRAAVESRRIWHIAARWVEAFAPVIWQPIDDRLRADALAERARLDAAIAAGEPLERPQVWILDDKPVWGGEKRSKRRDGGFFLLIIGEVTWEPPGRGDDPRFPVPRTRLRLVRAMAKSNSLAWRLCFDELGHTPDFVVADAGTGIGSAVTAHFSPPRTHFVPSLWHISHSIRRSLKAKSREAYNRPLEQHLAELSREGSALTGLDAWAAWWDELERLVRAEGLPVDKALGQRRNYEAPMAAVLPDLLTNPGVPVSAGGLETLIREDVDPALTLRTQFGNIERTNSLFDLVVARAHHAFDDLGAVAHQLRANVEPHDGWTVALRAFDDPQPEVGRYSSLRDVTLLATLARERGLT